MQIKLTTTRIQKLRKMRITMIHLSILMFMKTVKDQSEVAAHLGISRPTVTAFIKSRPELFDQVDRRKVKAVLKRGPRTRLYYVRSAKANALLRSLQ